MVLFFFFFFFLHEQQVAQDSFPLRFNATRFSRTFAFNDHPIIRDKNTKRNTTRPIRDEIPFPKENNIGIDSYLDVFPVLECVKEKKTKIESM